MDLFGCVLLGGLLSIYLILHLFLLRDVDEVLDLLLLILGRVIRGGCDAIVVHVDAKVLALTVCIYHQLYRWHLLLLLLDILSLESLLVVSLISVTILIIYDLVAHLVLLGIDRLLSL